MPKKINRPFLVSPKLTHRFKYLRCANTKAVAMTTEYSGQDDYGASNRKPAAQQISNHDSKENKLIFDDMQLCS